MERLLKAKESLVTMQECTCVFFPLSTHVNSPANYLPSMYLVPGTGVPPRTKQMRMCVWRKVVIERFGHIQQVHIKGESEEPRGENALLE